MIRFKTVNLMPMILRWWKPTKEEWTPILLDDHPQFWKKQVDPTTGQPWKKLSPGYAAWKNQVAPGNPILRLTGAMLDASYIYTRGNMFLVKTTPYGASNQFGTERKPARPWMGVPDISLNQLPPIAWKHITRRYRKL